MSCRDTTPIDLALYHMIVCNYQQERYGMTGGVFDINTGINMSIEATEDDMNLLAAQLNALMEVLESTEIN